MRLRAVMCVSVCGGDVGGAVGFTGKNPAGLQDENQTPQRPTEPETIHTESVVFNSSRKNLQTGKDL